MPTLANQPNNQPTAQLRTQIWSGQQHNMDKQADTKSSVKCQQSATFLEVAFDVMLVFEESIT